MMRIRNYALATRDVKKSFKMWKKKKNWVYGAILFLGSGAIMAVNTGNVQADEVNQATPIVTSVSTENTDSTNQTASDSKPVTDSQKATVGETAQSAVTPSNVDTSTSDDTNVSASADNTNPAVPDGATENTGVSANENADNENADPSTGTNVSAGAVSNAAANPAVTPDTTENTGITANENTTASTSVKPSTDTTVNEGTNVTTDTNPVAHTAVAPVTNTAANTVATPDTNTAAPLAANLAAVPTVAASSPTDNTGDLNAQFSNWTAADNSTTATGTFKANGSNYEVTMKGPTGSGTLEANTIEKTAEGIAHTYSFNKGTGSTGRYYSVSNGTINWISTLSDTKYYTSTNSAGNGMFARVFNSDSYQIAETVQVTQDGKIKHDVTIRNKSSEAITGLNGMGVSLDTMLDSDDRIPIYSDGTGGIYIQNGGITLYCSPVVNSNVFAGQWNDNNQSAYVTADGAEGTIIKDGVDTAVLYETPVTTLAPDQSITFSFAERVLVNTKVVEHLVDVTGKTIAADKVVGGQPGQAFDFIAPKVPGYAYQSTTGDLITIFGLEDKEITNIYKAIDYTLTTYYIDENYHSLLPTVTDPAIYHIGDPYQTQEKTIEGYELTKMPDEASGNFGAGDQAVFYIYKKSDQNVTVNYIDDATQTTLKTDQLTGKSGDPTSYSTATALDGYRSNGYSVVSDEVPANLAYDTDKTVDQEYAVHLTHAIKPSTKKTTRTIHYVVTDGSTPAPADKVQEITWAINTDLVTGKEVATPQAIYQSVDTPNLGTTSDAEGNQQAYVPDQAKVAEQAIAPTTDLTSLKDSNLTVTYNPVMVAKGIEVDISDQNINIDYIDDATQTTLKTDQLTGKMGATADYSTADTVTELQSQGYKLVSDGVPASLTYDNDTAVDQEYAVHLTHAIKSSTKKTTRTIHYVVTDGSTQAPADKIQEITWAINTDLVTGEGVATPKAIYQAVDSPNLGTTSDAEGNQQAYVPDQAKVAEQAIAPTTDLTSLKDSNLTVTYNTAIVGKGIEVDVSDQNIKINYIDDMTKATIKADQMTGKMGGTADYTTADTVTELQSQGYKLVSDGVPASLTYDRDTAVDQVYDVHLTHAIKSSTKKTTRTIHYVVTDGSTQAPADKVQEITWAINTDLVTGEGVATPQAIYQAVDTPTLTATSDAEGNQRSYIPDETKIAEQAIAPTTDLTSLKDSNLTVTYNTAIAGKGIEVDDDADQNISIVYVDDVTKATIKTDQLIGKSGEAANYSTTASVDELQSKGYRLVSDGVPANLAYDIDKTVDQVYDVHLTHAIKSSTKKTTRTIHYVVTDGSTQAPADKVQEITWAINTDLVTGEGVATPQAIYQAVDTPKLSATSDTEGNQRSYIPDETKVAEQAIAPTTDLTSLKDSNRTVTYNPAIAGKGIQVYTKAVVPPAVFVEESTNQVGSFVSLTKTNVPTKPIIGQSNNQKKDIAKHLKEKQAVVSPLAVSTQKGSSKGNKTLANGTVKTNSNFANTTLKSNSTLASVPLKTNEASQEKSYPKTGETKSNLSLIGILTIGLSSLMFLSKKRKSED
ncbi:LPXTG cell wall anchor domain-containing protein [Enterococcus durans]|uniref:mucin-binding protein n=1 Tax=Enterococcus durans TaxID=53345 RepID=UPI0018838D08|nr:MucBP domain-containing protein [Enterococcus durans]MBE9886658.1 LPXTG cell wall anchor domain-containing protein [Enterococcus durans]